jgi:predicted nucleic acid-binding protein
VLVALADERDALHDWAGRDLTLLPDRTALATTAPVLADCYFLLPKGYQRRRLRFLLERLTVAFVEPDGTSWTALFDWLERYEEHEPDFADGQLVVLSSQQPTARIWTYDEEYRTIWRRIDGSRIPLFGRRRRLR